MASLELIPKVPVLIAQTGVFLANVFVVKKLFVEPFLAVKDRRDAMTVGSTDHAKKILQEADQLANDITNKVETAYSQASAAREAQRNQALSRKTDLIKAADDEARRHIESIEKQIRQEVEGERQKIPAIVNSLTQEFYTKTIS
jgi:F-type H+-transporting ATPase subunit b